MPGPIGGAGLRDGHNSVLGDQMQEITTDVAIIGAGTSGMGAARAAQKYPGVSIVMIEGDRYGTTCARVGCMPSKLLIAAAEAKHGADHADPFGIRVAASAVDGKAVMARVRAERDRFVGFVLQSVEEDFPTVTKVKGMARFTGPNTLQVDDHTVIQAGRIVIATGSTPAVPPPWRDAVGDRVIVNDDVFDWDDLPDSVVAFGGGVIGLELAQALHRLGVRVRLFGKGGLVGPLTDPAVRQAACEIMTQELPFLPDGEVTDISRDGDAVVVRFIDTDGTEKIERFQYLLAATGRRPNLASLDLGKAGITVNERGLPAFDPYSMQIEDKPVFIAGDVNGAVPLLHEAADEGKIAGDNAARYPDVRVRPRRAGLSVVFSDPQIAMAGLTLREIEERGVSYATGQVDFSGQGRARVMLKNKGLLRVYGERETGRFLGAEMIGPAAEHIAHLLAWSAQANLSVQAMLDSPFYHPVIEEGLRSALRDLNRNLRMGPVPVEMCLDCGPGG